MAALTQDAWYEDQYPAGGGTPAQRIPQFVHRHGNTQASANHFIQSQIGGPLALLAAKSSQALSRVDF